MIEKGENITNFIFNKLGINSRNVLAALDRIVDGYPKVSGGSPYLSDEANKVLEKATKLAGEMGDQYVSCLLYTSLGELTFEGLNNLTAINGDFSIKAFALGSDKDNCCLLYTSSSSTRLK